MSHGLFGLLTVLVSMGGLTSIAQAQDPVYEVSGVPLRADRIPPVVARGPRGAYARALGGSYRRGLPGVYGELADRAFIKNAPLAERIFTEERFSTLALNSMSLEWSCNIFAWIPKAGPAFPNKGFFIYDSLMTDTGISKERCKREITARIGAVCFTYFGPNANVPIVNAGWETGDDFEILTNINCKDITARWTNINADLTIWDSSDLPNHWLIDGLGLYHP